MSPPPRLLRVGRMLTPDGFVDDAEIGISDGHFVEPSACRTAPRLEAGELCLLPGIIDLHGDAFERELAPRPGVAVPAELALAANDRALLAAGITTFFCAITDSFEPGPRSRASCRDLLAVIEALRPRLAVEIRIHLRHERANTAEHSELCDWIRRGQLDLLSLNDHLPDLGDARQTNRYLHSLRRRLHYDDAEARSFITDIADAACDSQAQIDELVDLANAAGVPLASHDDADPAAVAVSQARQVRIAEFPMSLAAAEAARAAGQALAYGAPNLLRGHSHVGAVSVRDCLQRGLVDVLVSDYHYPSLLRAPFLCAELGLASLAEAWQLVSAGPAAAAGLVDRGRIAAGQRADAILLRADATGLPIDIAGVFCAGHLLLSDQRLWPQAVACA